MFGDRSLQLGNMFLYVLGGSQCGEPDKYIYLL